MAKLRWNIPIRLKIVGLMALALTVSLLSYLYVGSSLVIKDKVSYVYDYNLAQVKTTSDAVESQIQKVLLAGRLSGSLVTAGAPDTYKTQLNHFFTHALQPLNIRGLLLLRPTDDSRFSPVGENGEKPQLMHSTLAQLGWTPKTYQEQEVLVGSYVEGVLPIGGKTVDATGAPLAFFIPVTLEKKLVEGGTGFNIQLYDSHGKVIVSSTSDSASAVKPELLNELVQSILKENFNSGVRDWKAGKSGKEYILGYQRLGQNRLLVVSLISKDLAFAAAQALVQRSVILGVSILFLAIGLTLIFVRRLTKGLRQMWHATQKVSEGDFSCRVDIKSSSQDEISGLANSFNKMADRIAELMLLTAQKARMEKELETAQAVQGRFFPTQDFVHPNLTLAGKSVPASECGGDWWYYAQIGQYTVVVIGDVVGHGVSSALVTAAAHGAFSILIRDFKSRPTEVPSVKALVEHLNAALLALHGTGSNMTFFASVIDMDTGLMHIVNASHRPPYVYRSSFGGNTTNLAKKMKPLMSAQCNTLGEVQQLEIEPDTFQLQPGDTIFWYTDGLVECENMEGKRPTRLEFMNTLVQQIQKSNSSARKTCDVVFSDMMEFLGDAAKNLPDDITAVVGVIPPTAKFKVSSIPPQAAAPAQPPAAAKPSTASA